MYKVILSIFLAATALVLISSHSGAYPAGRNASRKRVGVPEAIVHDQGVIHPAELSGDAQLAITLWSSENAASRAANAAMAAKARMDPGLVHVGVNVDESPAMFREILRRDNIENDSLQLHVSGDEAARLLSKMGYTTIFD